MNNLHGILFAYSATRRLKELSEHRTASSVPFGGRYRVIDFMLSSMVNAGVRDIGVIMRENYQSLLDHLGSGRDWDLSRKRGGLRLLPPFCYTGTQRGENYFRGRMEALGGVSSYISRIRQGYVVLADGDIVVNLPFDHVFSEHLRSGADITCLCTKNFLESDYTEAFYTLNSKNRITDIVSGKAGDNSDAYESMNAYIMSKQMLENLVSHCAARNLHHFNQDVLQAMKDELLLYAYPFDGYCARLTSVGAYYKHSLDLLDPDIRAQLFPRGRPILTKVRDDASTYCGQDSVVRNSFVADGCFIEGHVENSVIFRGVKVHAGAVVQNSILMQDTVVRKGGKLSYSVADKNVTVSENHMLMGHSTYPIAISKGAVV
ncbi:MAG: glucose-1-phosphate adenylyltransferase subunit GlgD [Oscillospiraceae bacterium]|nr:glucose-1-phosphate adenylyltransferase subunit GlgD [Oscillospiraceae bacterium]